MCWSEEPRQPPWGEEERKKEWARGTPDKEVHVAVVVAQALYRTAAKETKNSTPSHSIQSTSPHDQRGELLVTISRSFGRINKMQHHKPRPAESINWKFGYHWRLVQRLSSQLLRMSSRRISDIFPNDMTENSRKYRRGTAKYWALQFREMGSIFFHSTLSLSIVLPLNWNV